MNLFRDHFVLIIICITVIFCVASYAVTHRYVNAYGGGILDKWTGEVSRQVNYQR